MEVVQNKFMFFANFAETIKELPEEKRASAYQAICEYGIYGVLPEDESLKMLCLMAKASVFKEDGRKNNGGRREGAGRPKNNQVEIQDEIQDEKNKNQDDFKIGKKNQVEIQVENQDEKIKNQDEIGWGGKRNGAGRPKSPENQEKKSSLENQLNQFNQLNQLNQFLSRTETETETETEEKEIKKKNLIFSNPDLDEVLAFAREQDSMAGVGGFKCSEKVAREFFDFYAGQGWVTSGNIPIVNWQVKLRSWACKPNRFKSKDEVEEEELKPVICG